MLGAKTQPVLTWQPSLVHGLPSLQTIEGPLAQLPSWHASPPVQALPSSQGAVVF